MPEYPLSSDTFMVPMHAWICSRLYHRFEIMAFEEASGGGNFHVAFDRPDGTFVLADCNDGVWWAGIYADLAAPYEGEEISMLTLGGSSERTDPDEVAAWLAGVYRLLRIEHRAADEIRRLMEDDPRFQSVSSATAFRQADRKRGWSGAGFFSFYHDGKLLMVTVETVKE